MTPQTDEHAKALEDLLTLLGFGDTIYLLARTHRATYVDAFCIDASGTYDGERAALIKIGARLALLTDHPYVFHRNGFACKDALEAQEMVERLSLVLWQQSGRLVVSWI